MGSTTVADRRRGRRRLHGRLSGPRPRRALPSARRPRAPTAARRSFRSASCSPFPGLRAGRGRDAAALSGTNFLPGLTVTVGGGPSRTRRDGRDRGPGLRDRARSRARDRRRHRRDQYGRHQRHARGGWLADFWTFRRRILPRRPSPPLVTNGISAGCGAGNFCVDAAAHARAGRRRSCSSARNGLCFAPPPATGTVFADVHPGDFAADWIEALAAAGITDGCGGGDYCPQSPVPRAQMAVLLLKAEHGPDYAPPPCAGIFDDVPCPSAVRRLDRGSRQPRASRAAAARSRRSSVRTTATTRGQAAALLAAAFGLE